MFRYSSNKEETRSSRDIYLSYLLRRILQGIEIGAPTIILALDPNCFRNSVIFSSSVVSVPSDAFEKSKEFGCSKEDWPFFNDLVCRAPAPSIPLGARTVFKFGKVLVANAQRFQRVLRRI